MHRRTCCEAQMTPRKKLVNTLSFMDVHVLSYIYLVKGDRSYGSGKAEGNINDPAQSAFL